MVLLMIFSSKLKMVFLIITAILVHRMCNSNPTSCCNHCSRTFFVSQVDFTNPQAVTWYQEQLARSVALSFHGWMYDYGEYTPHDSISSDGTGGNFI